MQDFEDRPRRWREVHSLNRWCEAHAAEAKAWAEKANVGCFEGVRFRVAPYPYRTALVRLLGAL